MALTVVWFIVVVLVLVVKYLWGAISFSPVVFQYITNRDIDLKETDKRINVLLLGIGGGSHDGPNLTDTIIFASVDPSTKQVTLVSIPRDLWSQELGAKVNTAYAFGEERKKGEGKELARSTIEEVVGQPINYVVRIDFDGFVKAVDLLGGLDINVERTLDDYEYPIEGEENNPCGRSEEELLSLATASSQLEAFPCRYRHLHIEKGAAHMDGKTALAYVRSRHGLGIEGSDFARSKRQEKVIGAVKDKVFSTETLLNPSKVLDLYNLLKASIDTNVKQQEIDDFIKLAQRMKGVSIRSAIIDTGSAEGDREGFLVNPQTAEDYKGQWVLIPRIGNGNFSEIHEYVICEIEKGGCLTPTPTPKKQSKAG